MKGKGKSMTTNTKNMQVLLARRPKGWVRESDFRIVETEIPQLKDGEVLAFARVPLCGFVSQYNIYTASRHT
jgi:NADPH-dependent curcumin reductase CurA